MILLNTTFHRLCMQYDPPLHFHTISTALRRHISSLLEPASLFALLRTSIQIAPEAIMILERRSDVAAKILKEVEIDFTKLSASLKNLFKKIGSQIKELRVECLYLHRHKAATLVEYFPHLQFLNLVWTEIGEKGFKFLSQLPLRRLEWRGGGTVENAIGPLREASKPVHYLDLQGGSDLVEEARDFIQIRKLKSCARMFPKLPMRPSKEITQPRKE